MVAGHLREQNGIYQMVLSYYDKEKKRHTKSISTKLKVKGNKRRAEAMLDRTRKDFIPSLWNGDTLVSDYLEDWIDYANYNELLYADYLLCIRNYITPTFKEVTVAGISQEQLKDFFRYLRNDIPVTNDVSRKNIIESCYAIFKNSLDYAVSKGWKQENPAVNIDPFSEHSDVLFADYILGWLEMIKYSVDITTYAGYSSAINNRIVPYFREKEYTLKDLEENPIYIQDYYQYELNILKLSPNTILHRHANIRKSLQYAFQIGMIKSNPADRIEKPQKVEFKADYYKSYELQPLFKACKGDPLEIPIILAAFYGMRRSEVLGVKWSSIDLEKKTIRVEHVVTDIYLNGHTIHIEKDKTKSKSSTRTLPLVKPFEEALIRRKAEIEYNMSICGSSYCMEYSDYLNVDKMGNRMKPGYVSQHFKLILQKNGLRQIRYHDLRHSCATLLYDNGVDMKSIQEWLGHSTIATTANLYTHFDYSRKELSANAILANYPT